MKYSAPRGTQDILPSVSESWRRLESVCRLVMERCGYREIRTPVFEQKELFLRTVGEETDIVQKEMYVFEDRKGREFALRPEGTAPVIRAYVQNSLWQDRSFQKMYYMGPMFRYDRPQKGRYRQFHQIGAEAVGSLSPLVDAEVIAMVWEMLGRAGIRKLTMKINSLGEEESREAYTKALRGHFGPLREQLCPDCKVRLEGNTMRILDCKVASCIELGRDIPPMEEFLSDEAREHYTRVQHWLDVLGVPFERDPGLVRGLDYYTRTAFEVHHGELGASVALGGGGRYDRLVRELGGPDTPAIGFSLGTERVLLAAERDRQGAEEDGPGRENMLYIAWTGEEVLETAMRLASALRNMLPVEMDLERRSMKAMFRQADKLGVSHVLVLGERELAEKTVQMKDLRSGEQENVGLEALEEYIRCNVTAPGGESRGEVSGAGGPSIEDIVSSL